MLYEHLLTLSSLRLPLPDQDCCCLSQLFLPLSTHLCTLSRNLLCSLPLSDLLLYILRSKLSTHLCFHVLQAQQPHHSNLLLSHRLPPDPYRLSEVLLLLQELFPLHCKKLLYMRFRLLLLPHLLLPAVCSYQAADLPELLRELLLPLSMRLSPHLLLPVSYCCCLPRFHLQLQELLRISPMSHASFSSLYSSIRAFNASVFPRFANAACASSNTFFAASTAA